jgi:hypothetical protein
MTPEHPYGITRLDRYTGSDGKIVNDLRQAASAPIPPTPSPAAAPGSEPGQQATACAVPAGGSAAWPGHPILAAELAEAGFRPLELRVNSLDMSLPSGLGCEWTTLGEVPDAPGLYAFTVEDDHQMRVAYVGRTSHLWMVTRGHLPGGAARGGQRYGRPRHAGQTRQRVNVLIAGQLRAGRSVRHWTCPLPVAALHAEEERLIAGWDLRRCGWNRG